MAQAAFSQMTTIMINYSNS